MIQLFLIKPYDSLEIITEIPLGLNGITEMKLAVDLKQPYILKMIINAQLGVFYDMLKDQNNIGLRLRQLDADGNIDLELAFIKDRQPQINRASSRTEITFRSYSYLLDVSTRTIPYYHIYPNFIKGDKDSTQEFISSISNKYVFKLVGKDSTINFQTGTLNNLEMLNKAVENTGNWSWREAGIDSKGLKSVIEYGDFRKLGITAQALFDVDDNPFTKKDNIKIVGEPKINLNGEVITHLFATGGSSSGADQSQTVFLDDPNASWIDSDFPLVWMGETNGDGKKLYRIFNKKAYDSIGYSVNKAYNVSLSSNSTDSDNNLIYSYSDAQKVVYKKSVNYMREKAFDYSFSCDYKFNKIYLPGTRVQVQYTKYHESFDKYRTIIDFQDTVYLKNIEYNLLQFIYEQ
jgi:hypothetical protein